MSFPIPYDLSTLDEPPIPVVYCGCCSGYHRTAFMGDCRVDAERFADYDDAARRLGKPVIDVDNGEVFLVKKEAACAQST
jgi:hypothetical protein